MALLMKLTTLIKKKFGNDSLDDYQDSDSETVEHWAIQTDEESEPSYFIRVYTTHIEVTNTNGALLISGTESEVKNYIKKL